MVSTYTVHDIKENHNNYNRVYIAIVSVPQIQLGCEVISAPKCLQTVDVTEVCMYSNSMACKSYQYIHAIYVN